MSRGQGLVTIQAPGSFLIIKWNPEFSKRRIHGNEAENKPLLETLAETGTNLRVRSTGWLNELDNVIRDFMRGHDESDICTPEADIVIAFCNNTSFKRLFGETFADNKSLTQRAWLDERNFREGQVQARAQKGPLTAFELYKELKKPRFCVCGPGRSIRPKGTSDQGMVSTGTQHSATSGTQHSATAGTLHLAITDAESSEADVSDASGVSQRHCRQETEPPTFTVPLIGPPSSQNIDPASANLDALRDERELQEPDAERRLIFVTDLDGWTIHALIGTASRLQAPALRNALYRHLVAQTSIGATFASEGYSMFQLAFHLPYYAWRNTATQIEDHRRDADGRPMRQSHDVSFLNWRSDGSRSFIYEAQNSCVVAGTDVWRWVAYCFVESYFDVDDDARETVMTYHKESQIEGGVLMDPCTFGRFPLEDNIKDPRAWFLLVFQCRLNQVKGEWRQVVWKMEQSIRDYEKVLAHRYTLDPPGNHRWSGEARQQSKEIQKSVKWVVTARDLLRLLSQRLTRTVDACEGFYSTSIAYFVDIPEPVHVDASLCAFQKSFEDLKSLMKTLEDTAATCDRFFENLQLNLSHRQSELSQASTGMTLILMFCYPVTLALGVFSVNENILRKVFPYIPARPSSFIGIAAVKFVEVVTRYCISGENPSR